MEAITEKQTIKSESEPSSNKIIEYFSNLPYDESWSFSSLTQRHTTYITHSYHRYPAKFIPQLARRLVEEYTMPSDIVCDPFMGSGTALVEAIVAGRRAVGVDINPVAWLISKAKTTPVNPEKLEKEFNSLMSDVRASILKTQRLDEKKIISYIPKNERIDYWFTPEVKNALGVILARIKQVKDENVRLFFLCGFSHILKNCSIWLMGSTKPTRDFKKVIPNPIEIFEKHIKAMTRKNKEFYQLLSQNINCVVECQDARKLPVENNSVSLIVTSPPYVTSYEHADIHQLTALWLEYIDSLTEFRKRFIGTAYYADKQINVGSDIGANCVKELELKDNKKAKEVEVYFGEMRECFLEMFRVLKSGGKACIVIGNTSFKGVEVPNAEVFVEQMINMGFKLHKVIKRLIPSKILPQIRDVTTGRFTSPKNGNKTLAYPHEYIIIMEKP